MSRNRRGRLPRFDNFPMACVDLTRRYSISERIEVVRWAGSSGLSDSGSGRETRPQQGSDGGWVRRPAHNRGLTQDSPTTRALWVGLPTNLPAWWAARPVCGLLTVGRVRRPAHNPVNGGPGQETRPQRREGDPPTTALGQETRPQRGRPPTTHAGSGDPPQRRPVHSIVVWSLDQPTSSPPRCGLVSRPTHLPEASHPQEN